MKILIRFGILLLLLSVTVSVRGQSSLVSSGGDVPGLSFTVGQVFQHFDLQEAQGIQFPDEWRWYTSVELKKDELLVYPNPVIDILNINSNRNLTFRIHGMDGRLLKSGEGREVDLSDLPSSVYLLKVRFGDKLSTFKIVKQ